MTLEEAVYKKLNDLINPRKAALVNGDVQDFHEYKRLTGYIQGAADLMKEIDPYIRSPEDVGEFDGR